MYLPSLNLIHCFIPLIQLACGSGLEVSLSEVEGLQVVGGIAGFRTFPFNRSS